MESLGRDPEGGDIVDGGLGAKVDGIEGIGRDI